MSFSRAAPSPADLSSRIQSFQTSLGRLETATSGPLDASKCRAADRLIQNLDESSAVISDSLRTSTEPNVADLRRQFSSFVDHFQLVKADYLRNKPALTPPPRQAPDPQPVARHGDNALQAQAVAMDPETELAFLQAGTEDVLRQQRELSILQKQIGDAIDDGHVKLVKVDEKVEEAKHDMVKGNNDLQGAEKHQKTCGVA
jgi:hypothetical protein